MISLFEWATILIKFVVLWAPPTWNHGSLLEKDAQMRVYEAVLRKHIYISSHLLFRTEFSRKFFIACLQFVSL